MGFLGKKQPKLSSYNKWKKEFPEKDVLTLMPRELVEDFKAFVFHKSNKGIKIAAVDPQHPPLVNFIKERFGNTVEWFTATKDDISFILKSYIRDFKDEIVRLVSAGTGADGNIVELVDRILAYAIDKQASDVHIEPRKNDSLIRFRVDGVLHSILTLPHSIHLAVVARLKLLANLKIDDYRHSQDGRIELEQFLNISLRISTMPILYGEKVVLRILDDSSNDLSMNSLGLSQEQQKIIMRNIEKPFGMIIASGPTGSGKTTTLYGLLYSLITDRINISTLEDPIEYAIPGVNQVQINPRFNLTFASGLRSLLRQDPDVIMVGEIRDSETAIMSAEAALTGHLVFTTVHTNDAPSAITRFLEMKVEEFTVASVVNVIIAQRLVRKICNVCAKKQKLDEIILKKIREREDVIAVLKSMKKNINDLEKEEFLIGKGCDACLNTGYRGRVGIFELMEVNKKIHDLILERTSSERIKAEAKQGGFHDMITDGIEKVFSGVTTLEEVLRATRSA